MPVNSCVPGIFQGTGVKREFKDWTRVFGDETLTAAPLDNLIHNAHVLVFVGESYRFKQSLRQREL